MDDAERLIEDVRIEEEGRALVEEVDRAREEVRDFGRRLALGEIDRPQHGEAVAAAGLRIVELMDRLDSLGRPEEPAGTPAEGASALAPGSAETLQSRSDALRAFLDGGGLGETLDDLSGVVRKVGGPMILAIAGAGLAVFATAVAVRDRSKA